MKIVCRILHLLAAMLFSALSAVAMPMALTVSHQAEFSPFQQALIAEHADVHFTARAPPIAVANVAVTGAIVAEQGDGIFMHGHETHVASLDFGVGLDATNRTVTVHTSRATRGTPEYELLNNPPANTRVELDNGTAFRTNEAGYVRKLPIRQ